MADERKRIVILGGGFGGLYTAMELEKQLGASADLTLVNRQNYFSFTPMLHEVAASDLDMTHIVNPVRKMLRKCHFFLGDVERIDLPGERSSSRTARTGTITSCRTTIWSSASGRSRTSPTCPASRSAP